MYIIKKNYFVLVLLRITVPLLAAPKKENFAGRTLVEMGEVVKKDGRLINVIARLDLEENIAVIVSIESIVKNRLLKLFFYILQ